MNKMSKDSSEREKYWNEDYVRYWKARVGEANESSTAESTLVSGDAKTTTDKSYIDAIALLDIGKSDRIVEIGCGFGRSLPLLSEIADSVAAVDISEQMIKSAQESCNERNITFHVSPSESLPFPDESFDVVVCFAAFDAMYQTEALIEMNRICRVGGRILITGKNDDYLDEDVAAIDAEIGARKKNHPNYFTDVKTLVEQINKFGFSITSQNYFSRRGDFAEDVKTHTLPDRFYEFLFVLKKEGRCSVDSEFEISNLFSKTFKRSEKHE